MLFADEPTGNLDETTGIGIADMLFDAARDLGTTLVLVTHDVKLAQRADRIAVMQDGEIIEIGPHAELASAGGRYAELLHLQLEGIPAAR